MWNNIQVKIHNKGDPSNKICHIITIKSIFKGPKKEETRSMMNDLEYSSQCIVYNEYNTMIAQLLWSKKLLQQYFVK